MTMNELCCLIYEADDDGDLGMNLDGAYYYCRFFDHNNVMMKHNYVFL